MSAVEIARNHKTLQVVDNLGNEFTLYCNGGEVMVSLVEVPKAKGEEAEIGRTFLDLDTLEVVLMEALDFVRSKNPKLP
jgi:hypothetical protein